MTRAGVWRCSIAAVGVAAELPDKVLFFMGGPRLRSRQARRCRFPRWARLAGLTRSHPRTLCGRRRALTAFSVVLSTKPSRCPPLLRRAVEFCENLRTVRENPTWWTPPPLPLSSAPTETIALYTSNRRR